MIAPVVSNDDQFDISICFTTLSTKKLNEVVRNAGSIITIVKYFFIMIFVLWVLNKILEIVNYGTVILR